MIAVLLFLAIAWFAGFGMALAIDRRASGALLAGESLLFGIAGCSLPLLVIPWRRWIFVAAVMAIAIIAYAVAIRVHRDPEAVRTRRSALAIIFVVATIVLLIGYARLATAAPLWEFDFLVDWGLKARQFFIAHGVDWAVLQGAWYRGTHPDYPPLLTLAFDGVAILRGSWSDGALGLLNVAFAGALLLAVYRFAIEETESSLAASFVTLALVPLAAVPWIGLAEAPFIAYATAALLLMRTRVSAAGAVMLGLAAMTKNEGASLIVAVAVALIAVRRWREVPRLWPAVAIPLPWWILRSAHHLQTDITSGNVLARIAQHASDPEVLHALVHYSLGKPLFWIALAAGVALTFRGLDRFVVTALALQLVFYLGAYLATPHDVSWHVQWSWERLVAHLTPALTFLVLVRLVVAARRTKLAAEEG